MAKARDRGLTLLELLVALVVAAALAALAIPGYRTQVQRAHRFEAVEALLAAAAAQERFHLQHGRYAAGLQGEAGDDAGAALSLAPTTTGGRYRREVRDAGADRYQALARLCATRGEAGIFGVNPEEAGAIRERELRKAAEHLGIEVYFLGYQDGELAQTKPEILLDTVTCWIDHVQPQVILTFGLDGISGHPDHVTISHIVTQAYDLSYNKGLLLYIRPSLATALGCGVTYSNMDAGQPQVEVDISGYKLNKIRAIKSHVSQDPGLPGRPEDEMGKIPDTELYTIARDAKTAENYPDWFETAREEPMIAIREAWCRCLTARRRAGDRTSSTKGGRRATCGRAFATRSGSTSSCR